MEEKAIKVYRKLKDAVVSIVTKYASGGKSSTYTGSGFFISHNKKLYIITAAHLVLHTTIVDPMTSIVAGIQNVNNTGKNLVYSLKIVGVDATADVAILKINTCEHSDIPNYKSHPSITLGNELKTPVGTNVLNISNPLDKDLQSLAIAPIRNNKWFDNTGSFIASNVTTSLLVYPASSGSPVIDINTELCISIIGFGFTDESNVNEIGFSGGCGANTIKIIVDHILNKKSVNPVIGQKYLTNLKGYLGDITWRGADTLVLSIFYPNTYMKLQLRGFLLLKNDPNGPLSNLLGGAPPLSNGDIIVWAKHNGKKIEFGGGSDQFPLGTMLWPIDPDNKDDNVIKLGVIRNPENNTKIEVVKTKLNINPDQNTERPPQGNLPLSVEVNT